MTAERSGYSGRASASAATVQEEITMDTETHFSPDRKDSRPEPAERRSPGKHFKAHYPDSSCVLCGTHYIEKGRILHGHCVCEDCVEYILSEADSEKETAE